MSGSAVQIELFGGPVLVGLAQAQGIVTPDEEQALIAAIDRAELSPFRFHGWEGRRLTASFGWRYDYDSGRFARAAPIPDWLLPLQQRVAAFAGLAEDALTQASLIRYEPSAGIGWHRDRPMFEHVLGVSFGAAATMRFRRRRARGFERASAALAPRSVYHLSGQARWDWEHSIAGMGETRWSITFRGLR